MNVSLFRIILPVGDIERAASFYRTLFDDDGVRVSPGRHYFDCGGTILACYEPEADGDGPVEYREPQLNQYVYFSIPDLENMLSRIEAAGGRVTSEIERMPWGETLFYAKDPFGNLLSFVEKGTEYVGE